MSGTVMRNTFDRKKRTMTPLGAWKGGSQLNMRYAGVYRRSSPRDTRVLINASEYEDAGPINFGS
jgi:hypothetical protein